jgi:hypothetical protein
LTPLFNLPHKNDNSAVKPAHSKIDDLSRAIP